MSAALAALVDWLSLPLSGAAEHAIEPRVAWHGRAMVLAWGVLVPLGALAARFLKILPPGRDQGGGRRQGWPQRLDNQRWWHAHRAFQYLGVALTAAGVTLVWRAGPGAPPSLHAWFGWTVAAVAILQVAGGWMRGSKGSPSDPAGDHYAMTRRRVVFERVHKSLGWAAVLVGMVAIALGLALADAPRWMPVALGLWWLLLAVVAVVLQRRGWCADTYQAIWGPSPAHPGNRIPPVGWGIRRGSGIAAARQRQPIDPEQSV